MVLLSFYPFIVMPGLYPGIHAPPLGRFLQRSLLPHHVDARVKPGRDGK